MRHIAVLDIGKTNAKLALVDLDTRVEVAVRTRPNRVIDAGPYPHFDTEALWDFVLDGLHDLHATRPIDGLSVTTHGACAALLAADGTLAAPVLDYEHAAIGDTRAAYDALRPGFGETGSPALSGGLNLGAQLHWQFARDATLRDRVAQVVTWPQYWGFRLTGEVACDLCSLGCHTDLWNPRTGTFSALPARLGIADRIAAPRRPGDRLGTLLPDIARCTGLPPDTPVLVGIHDSNASLLPHLCDRTPPFSVVSTGTWVVAMAMGAAPVTLDPARDTLVNVNALGQPVPSARFMGGREHERVSHGRAAIATKADLQSVVARGTMLLPAVDPGSGPFPGRTMRWTAQPKSDGEAEVALAFYLALMTAECLALVGASGDTIVEGPFAANPWYARMLQAATGRAVLPSAARTGTAVGAALLFAPATPQPVAPSPFPAPDAALAAYGRQWRAAAVADGP